MRKRVVIVLGLAGAASLLLSAEPARADLTVIGRYTFVNGDTATLPSYFSGRRVRVPTPDGREVVFDSHTRAVTLIDHARRAYWSGPLARADSIVDVLDATRWDLYVRHASDSLKAEWLSDMDFPSESIKVSEGLGAKMIAGYPCNPWTVTAGPFVKLQRWVAYSLAVDDYHAQTEDLVLSAVLDPVGRAIMGMFWESQVTDALPLAANVTFDSPTRHAHFEWRALRVVGARIPDSAWRPPPGYQRVDLGTADPPDQP